MVVLKAPSLKVEKAPVPENVPVEDWIAPVTTVADVKAVILMYLLLLPSVIWINRS